MLPRDNLTKSSSSRTMATELQSVQESVHLKGLHACTLCWTSHGWGIRPTPCNRSCRAGLNHVIRCTLICYTSYSISIVVPYYAQIENSSDIGYIPDMALQQNRHIIDRMGDIKEQIELLQDEYADLRQHVINERTDLAGEEFKATVRQVVAEHIDSKKAKDVLAPDIYQQILKTRRQTNVAVRRLATA